MSLVIGADFELHHFAKHLKLCENIFLKFTKMLIDFLIFVFKGCITVEFISQCFPQSKMIVEIRNDNCIANGWMLMMPGANITKTAHSRLGEKGTYFPDWFIRRSRRVRKK